MLSLALGLSLPLLSDKGIPPSVPEPGPGPAVRGRSGRSVRRGRPRAGRRGSARSRRSIPGHPGASRGNPEHPGATRALGVSPRWALPSCRAPSPALRGRRVPQGERSAAAPAPHVCGVLCFCRKSVRTPLCRVSQRREKLVPVELDKREKEQLY